MSLRRIFAALCLACIACTAGAEGNAPTEPQPSAIPFKRDPPSAESETSRVFGGLAICLLALGGTVYYLRRRLGLAPASSAARLVRVLETQRVSPRLSLHVVEFGGSLHLLADGEHGLQCIVSSPGALPAAPAAEAPK